MLSDINRNQGLYKAIFLVIGVVLIVFCFFFNVSEAETWVKGKYYLTFSARAHSSLDGIDCYMEIPKCDGNSFCNTVKTTPYLGGFCLGFAGLVLLFSLAESLISRVIKKYHIWIIQMILLFISWALIVIIPVLYLTTKGEGWKLCWLPIIFEFAALISITISALLYYKSNQTKVDGLLS